MYETKTHPRAAKARKLLHALPLGLLAVAGCAGQMADAPEGDGESAGSIAQAFSALGLYSWGDTVASFAKVGTSVGRTCFLMGVAGVLTPSVPKGTTIQTSAGLRINAQKEYELYVEPAPGSPLNVYAGCVNTAAGRTAEQNWHTGQSAMPLAPVAGGRRCFLTSVLNTNVVPSLGGYGFKTNDDSVQVFQDSSHENWYLGGTQSGVAAASAMCIDVAEDRGSWEWIAGDPGTRKDKLSDNPGGATCMLTGLGGHFDRADWVDGAFISYDAGINQYYMNTKNGKTGWATCVR